MEPPKDSASEIRGGAERGAGGGGGKWEQSVKSACFLSGIRLSGGLLIGREVF